MNRIVIFALIFVLGVFLGIIVQYSSSGATERARIAALENELKSRNEKLERCTDALINGLHTNAPQTAPPLSASPK
jgi:hypothetical protein